MVAQHERIGSTVITIDVERHGLVAVEEDDERACFVEAGRLRARRAAPEGSGRPVRVLVEVQRRFGGLAPRALLGARFLPVPTTDIVFEVDCAPGGASAACPSRLWSRPFTVGLPEEFASAVLDALLADATPWPAGVLRVDRAGFDEIESSEVVFGQAAGVLACAMAAMLREQDLEAAVRAVMGTW